MGRVFVMYNFERDDKKTYEEIMDSVEALYLRFEAGFNTHRLFDYKNKRVGLSFDFSHKLDSVLEQQLKRFANDRNDKDEEFCYPDEIHICHR